MSRINRFTGLSEFLAVARLGSFRAAAAELKVTSAAVSQAVKSLERRTGATLFLRSTRSVALTEAGTKLQSRLLPAVFEIDEAIEALTASGKKPMGHLKLSVPRIALDLVLLPLLPAFRNAHPEISVEVDVNDQSIDVITGHMDAGIRLGHFIELDMVTVRLSAPFKWCVVGAPQYFAKHGRPKVPRDLVDHECIGYRFPTAKMLYRWQFRKAGRELSVDTSGGIIVNDHLSMLALAKSGVGLAYIGENVAKAALNAGSLESVLADFCPTNPGMFLYFPTRSQNQPKLRAFINFLKQALGKIQ